MKEFRRLEDVGNAHIPKRVAAGVERVLCDLIQSYAGYGVYDPGANGESSSSQIASQARNDAEVILIESGDTDDDIRAVLGGHTLLDATLEGCVHVEGCFHTCVLFNNEYGVSVLVQDVPWLDPAIRKRLEDNL